jgi:hypothetical protein
MAHNMRDRREKLGCSCAGLLDDEQVKRIYDVKCWEMSRFVGAEGIVSEIDIVWAIAPLVDILGAEQSLA